MKKTLSVFLIVTMLFSLCALSVLNTHSAQIDVADIKERTYAVSQLKESEIIPEEFDGYVYGVIGDIDNDGKVTVLDATLIQMYNALLTPVSATFVMLGDVNLDGSTSVMDATEIQRYLALLSQSDTIEHLLYSPYDNFDPLYDTFDEIKQYVIDEGKYSYTPHPEGTYHLTETLTDDEGETSIGINYMPRSGDLSFTHVSYFNDGTYSDNQIIVTRGSREFSFSSYSDLGYDSLILGGTGRMFITEDYLIEFEFEFTYIDTTYYEYTEEALSDYMSQLCLYDISAAEYLIQDKLTGTVLDLLYDTTLPL